MSFQEIMKKARTKSCWKLNDNMVAKSVTPPIETKDVLSYVSQKMKPPKAKTSPRAPVPMSPRMSPKASPKMSQQLPPKLPPMMSPKMSPKMSPQLSPKIQKRKSAPKFPEKLPLTRRGSTTGPIGPNSDFSGGFYPVTKTKMSPTPKLQKEPIKTKISPPPEPESIALQATAEIPQNPYLLLENQSTEFPTQTLYEYNPSSSVSDWLTRPENDFDAPRTPSSGEGFPVDDVTQRDLQPRFESMTSSYHQQPWQNEMAKDFCGGYPVEPPKPVLDQGPIRTLETENFAPMTQPEAKPFHWQTSFDLANVCHQKKSDVNHDNSLTVGKSVAKPVEKPVANPYPWRPQPAGKPMNSMQSMNASPINLCEVNLTSLIDESTSCYASQLIADLEEKMKQKSTPVFQPVVFNPNGFLPLDGAHTGNLTNQNAGFQSEESQALPDGEQLEVTAGEEVTHHPSEEAIHPEETVRKALTNEPDAMELAKECFQLDACF